MKKFICLVLLLVTCVIFIDACSSKLAEQMQSSIAEVHYNIYVGASDEVSCTYSGGKREQTYLLNGYSTPLVDFGLLTFVVDNTNATDDTPTFTLNYNNTTLDGVLEKNPYDGSYVADIRKIIDNVPNMIATIRMGSYTKSINLLPISPNWKITYNDALQIAIQQNKKLIKNLFVRNKNFEGEIYIKVLHDHTNNGTDIYYWFVSVLGRDGNKLGVLVDNMTGKIVATKR